MYKGGIFQLRLTITFLGVIMNIVMMVILSPWPDKRFQGGFYSFYLEIIIIWLRKSVFFTIIIMKIMNHKWCKLLLFNFDDGENISTIITTPNSYYILFETKSDSNNPHTLNIVDFSGALFRLRILSNLMSRGRQRCQQYFNPRDCIFITRITWWRSSLIKNEQAFQDFSRNRIPYDLNVLK